jgi:hypothetical protein
MKIIIIWMARGIAAIIMLQTLYFKFSGAEESIYIFTTVGMEPWGRVGSGVAELIASLLILIPRTSVYGAVVGAGVMAGAIASHLFILGLEVMGDGGQLFIYACLVMISCLFIVWVDKERLLRLLPKSS